MLTLLYALLFVALGYLRPFLGLFALIVLSQPGFQGLLGAEIGLKAWALHPLCFVLGLVGIQKLVASPVSSLTRVGWLFALTGIYVFLSKSVIFRSPIAGLFYTLFHGGLLAVFFLVYRNDYRLWKGVFWGLMVLLGMSAATYWLSPTIPALAKFDGVSYSAQSEVTSYTGHIYELVERTVRGGGVFGNANCWAQVSAVGGAIGLALALERRHPARPYGLLLFVFSILGLLGSMGRSSILAGIVGVLGVLASRYIRRSAGVRGVAAIAVLAAGAVLVVWATRQYAETGSLALGSDEGLSYRLDQISGVCERLGNYWLAGSDALSQSIKQDDPHDIVFANIYYFGLLPALVPVLAIFGGLRGSLRWISVGGARLAKDLEFMPEIAWAGHVVVPVFLVILICGLGNGVAGGTPYRELFLLYASLLAADWKELHDKQRLGERTSGGRFRARQVQLQVPRTRI